MQEFSQTYSKKKPRVCDDAQNVMDTEREEDQALGRERHSLHDIFH